MGVLPRPRRRVVTRLTRLTLFSSLIFGVCVLYYGLHAYFDSALGGILFGTGWLEGKGRYSAQDKHTEMFERLDMTTEECSAVFPGLTKEIEAAVARGPFELQKKSGHATGMVQGRIKDGKLYVISVDRHPVKAMKWERNAVLQQIHRALVTSPEPIPDMAFAFSVIDSPRLDTWSFSRSNHPDIAGENYWVMPHFSFWSWPLKFIGTVNEALQKILVVERETPWEEKIDKAVWRGTAWFNSVGNTQLRPMLLERSKGKEWADIETLKWESGGEKAENAIPIEEFCRYKYIIYTEGITYSGRLPFHQACESIILTPPLTYFLHTTHLVRPLHSRTLPLSTQSTYNTITADRWPSYAASEANMIFVAPDWADLEETIEYLRANPDVAKGIARRQRELVTEMGYLSPAAEACYWRALMRGWASVVRTEEVTGWEEGGVRFETFVLRGEVGWE